MEISRALLMKFSRDECTPEEIQAIQEWLNDGSWPAFFEDSEVSVKIRERVWDKLQGRIHQKQIAHLKTRPRYKWVVRIAAMAAALLVLIGLTLVFKSFLFKTKSKPYAYVTGANENKKIVLSDSSVVFLSPRSKIQVTQPFAQDKREIKLTGQAVFEVAKDASRPFTVMTGKLSTTALGTSFKVIFFADKKHIKVALSYGKVVVKDSLAEGGIGRIFLDPGEEMVYDKASETMQKTLAPETLFDYKENILYFKNATLPEVVEKLQRYYHVRVKYDALIQVRWKVSGEFDYQPLQTIMKTLAYSCNIHYTLENNILTLLPNS